jgi:hypothetical protein
MRRLFFLAFLLVLQAIPFVVFAQKIYPALQPLAFLRVDGRVTPQKDGKRSIGRQRQRRAWWAPFAC